MVVSSVEPQAQCKLLRLSKKQDFWYNSSMPMGHFFIKMIERRASLRETLGVAKEAVSFALDQREKAMFNNDMFMFPWEKAAYFLSLFRPAELRRWIKILSSYKYGQWVFDSVFPRYENPEDYHSTEYEICLDDNPVQVLGWQEQKELFQQGVEQGLKEDWINAGFILRSRERGIDLDCHFFEFAPGTDEQNCLLENQEARRLID